MLRATCRSRMILTRDCFALNQTIPCLRVGARNVFRMNTGLIWRRRHQDMNDNTKWLIYQDQLNEWRWRRSATNGEIIGDSSEGYKNRSDCEGNANRHGYGGCSAIGYYDTWEFWADTNGKHRWKRHASNGVQVGASSQGYSTKSYCEDNARLHCYHG